LADVQAIERSTRYFAATDAEIGGALSREAAVGQLKYAVDLARHGSYSDRTGNRLLAAVAELSGLVGWLCHDSNMPGPAQRYLMYGLQAARESSTSINIDAYDGRVHVRRRCEVEHRQMQVRPPAQRARQRGPIRRP
jgi:hypothetical protein